MQTVPDIQLPRLVKKSDNNKTTPVVDDTAVLAEGRRRKKKKKNKNLFPDVSIDVRMRSQLFRRNSTGLTPSLDVKGLPF